ncbi:hypothetical protein T4E_4668 [Trichinella pseudospiralis]|uniref:Uncharacterized protein n=1 Tax=Trichinella pseudospiralis TaxID=6337 RepID=A0A0V0YA50_TRIPS|nr:hypothetical protein T4E_4668 [Trichinella pseudospiralis]
MCDAAMAAVLGFAIKKLNPRVVFVRETPGRHLIFEKHLLSKRKSLLQSTMPAFAGLDQQSRDVAFPVSIR